MANMGNVLGLIFSNMHDSTIEELTKERTMGSVLFGGRYRLIDFPISNMVNSGITKVGVITKANFQSLLDHLGSGREWDLSRKKGGLHILPPFGNNNSGIYRGRIEALNGIMSFLTCSSEEYVFMSDCDIVANMDLRPVVDFHIEKGADITAVSKKGIFTMERTRHSTTFVKNEQDKVYDVLINPEISGMCNLSLNMFVVKKDLLIHIVQQAISRSLYSFERDVLQAKIRDLNVYAYNYDGYMSRIDSINSFFEANMDLLVPENSQKLFPRNPPIYTKVRDNAPCKYGIGAQVTNSLIADGCIIDGQVENCIIFRGVKVGKGSVVRNSIIMQDTVINGKCDINYIITDKNVTVGEYRSLHGSQLYPLYVGKGAIV